MFARLGVPVCDSDTIVHALYDEGGAAVAPIAGGFPGAVIARQGRSRQTCRSCSQPILTIYARLEAIVHPLVRAEQQRFVERCRKENAKLAVLDIPLLFETGRERDVDRDRGRLGAARNPEARAMKRPGMTEEKFASLLARQMPDREKRARADFIVDSSQGTRSCLCPSS